MATSLIASSTAAGTSSDITVAAGAPVTVFINTNSATPIPGDANVQIQIKNAGGAYSWVGQLIQANPTQQIVGPGTYRVVKSVSGTAYGVDQG